MKKSASRFSAMLALAAAYSFSAWAGPITTVPWNGHDGAVSFTFDDGYNQLGAIGNYLNSNPDVKVTFFITGAMGAGSGNMSDYLNMAKNGHEIGNHSKSHKDMTGGVDLTAETSGWKSSLLQKGAPEVYTFATPFCASNNNVANAISKDHIANRNCAGAKYYGWSSEPEWMNISSNCYTQGGSSTGNAKNNMGSAKSQKAWTVQLNHGVGVNDTYGIATNDMTSIMDEAKKQGLWIAPFGVVAAYYRAHFAIDKATATTTSDGFKVTWTSPHSAMPKSVPLRVNIQNVAGRAVSQKGRVIAPNSDGTYTIDFMAMELNVTGEPPEVKPFKGAIEIPGTIEGENYDTYAYEHANSGSDTTGYRSDDAGIVKAGTGYALGYTTVDDYFEYTLDVKTAGKYKVSVNGATGNAADGSVTVSVGTQKVKVAVVAQGDWNTYSEVDGDAELDLATGKQTLRLTIDNDNLNVDWIKLTSAAVASESSSSSELVTPAESSSSGTDAIATGFRLNVGAGMVKCSVFDMNGNLVKSANVAAGSVGEIWSNVNVGLREGAYVLRYGTEKSVQSIRVRK
ncbi:MULTISPECIES: polysaccharide deacetylase family protein [unclassified Fibrobacter]|uniref:polysaccharide deacetylase family protein n=1 Tax=unclassified Fibrobacter TaxID=2634177 RepID=UPI000D793035|nr:MULTISPECIES: polysaccharide deacetylase family protein [unclassified Fibrobacter]PWJ69028.1 peptidoglycan/xylan/chitin deacetylase (PgdA/CDA1 family) [Fibrobacter sp. UWR4]PZW70874.1 peptidoglycan/xylan/chitin deacetylase (PgdA/CDA1 family) [Fibrobacter sp. UWR1]